MAAKTLKNYLEKIDAGEAINLRAFQKLIASISSFDGFAESDLQSVKKGAHTYILSYIDPEKLAFLHYYAESQGEDRVSGAMQNNSHAFKVNGSLLLIQKYQNHPDVLIFKDDGRIPKYKTNKSALILENRELFIHSDKTFKFLSEHCQITEDMRKDIDVIFGAGTEITNSLHLPFLSLYNTLYLCLDLDLGGIKTATSLINNLPSSMEIHFVIPNDVESRLKQVIDKCSPEYMQKVYNLDENMPQALLPCIRIIKKHNTILEQEAYLYGY